jgi:hypothetical protein
MKKNKILILVVAILAVAWLVFNRNNRILLSRLHPVLDLKAEDIGAIVLVSYDVVHGEYGLVRNVKPKLIIGDTRLVKKRFGISGVSVEEGRGYIDKIFNALPDVRGHEGPEYGIPSMYDAGMAFFTKDGKMILLELMYDEYIAKVPCKELWPILNEVLEKHQEAKL